MSGEPHRRSLVGRLGRAAWRLAAIIGAVAAAATAVGLFGSLGWPFDLANAFRPQYGVVLVTIGAVAVMLRRAVTAVLLLTAGILNVGLVAPYVMGAGPDPSAPGAQLTIVSFNVGISNPNRAPVARYLGDLGPDLIVLMESSFEWEDAVAAAGLPMATVAIVPIDRVTGITILADPSLRAVTMPTGFAPIDQALAVAVEVEGTRVLVLALHPPSPMTPSRHRARDALLADAGRWVASQEHPVIVVGDLNATPWSAAFRELRWRGRLRDTMEGAGLQPTFRRGWGPFAIPIDHALHTAGVDTVRRGTGPTFGSDHRPLIVTLAVAD